MRPLKRRSALVLAFGYARAAKESSGVFASKKIAVSLFSSGTENQRSGRYNINLFEEILASPSFERECQEDTRCSNDELREYTSIQPNPEQTYETLFNQLWRRCYVEPCDPSGASTF